MCYRFSKWVMMSQDTRRLQKVSGDVRDEHLMFCPKEPRKIPKGLKKIPKLEDLAKYSIIGRKPRRADLDMNHHVNNVTYIGWLLEVTGDIASPESGVIQKFPVMKGATVEQENK
ncbi:hypothetical protein Rs2_09401 [Raphanus sativus]|nr:hypothetical protein Rs2_09401 [Raphanus sativus]